MCKYEMDPMSILEDTERTRFCPQTDRRTDGQGDTSIPPYQLRWRGGGYNKTAYKFDSNGEPTVSENGEKHDFLPTSVLSHEGLKMNNVAQN